MSFHCNVQLILHIVAHGDILTLAMKTYVDLVLVIEY